MRPGGPRSGNGREAAQVDADLGDEDLSDTPPHARDGIEQRHRLLKRAHTLPDLRTHPLKESIPEVDVHELLGNQEALMRLELAGQRLLQGRDLLAQAPAR